mgnify:CR=1 FL=1
MKKIRKTIVYLLAALLFVPFIISCKKGEDDPWLSLRSRTKRLTGTWKITEVTSENKSYEYKKTTNTINSDYEQETDESTETSSYDGSTWTLTDKVVDHEKSSETTWDPFNSEFITTITDLKKTVTNTIRNQVTCEITINEDNTYEANFTIITKSYSTDTVKIDSGLTTTGNRDTTYSPSNSYEFTEEGVWAWGTENNDPKDDRVYINFIPYTTSTWTMTNSASFFSGKITRLANKEMVIEDVKEDNSFTDNSTEYTNTDIMHYSDTDNPYDTSPGRSQTVENETDTYTFKATFEKQK